MPVYSKEFLSFGNEYCVIFGDKRLTLNKGKMYLGRKLPSLAGLCTPELTPPYFMAGKRKLIFTVPSLDTPVCEYQIKDMSDKMESCKDETDCDIYVVSVDTPFAQARFIKNNKISDRINFLSAYADHSFLNASGLCINELNIFARSIIACDELNTVTHIVVTQDITHIPTFDLNNK
ncbi:redoxin domain-containing protein [Salmonella enterica]|nr:peroxiredoxin [Salmonella enterica]EDG0444373.1 redoxin domain-containing protein [Salmonella enterica subsp. enterica serovar Newport]EAT3803334.1 redoxin domain-containing protein [Salmonella enterica]EAV7927164.1 redoxin domain-containing protein [Salmonella enterica]EBH4549951.1 redoxin domain-containing protein [Salmonella enterica]